MTLLYRVNSDFIKISETSGTIQNTSRVFDLEVSNQPEPNSGIILFGLNKFSFSNDETIYLRCIDGVADVRVVPFTTDATGGGSSVDDFDSQLDSIFGGDSFANDSDMENAFNDIFNGGGISYASDTDVDSALDDIFNP